MAWTIDQGTKDIVISGFENGIGVTPYSGLTDAKSVNLSSIPGEASVNFSTVSVTSPAYKNVAVTGVNASAPTYITFGTSVVLDNGMAINFTNLGSLTGVNGTSVYWVTNYSSGQCALAPTFPQSSNVTIGGTAGGATFSTYNMGVPKFFARAAASAISPPNYFLLDNNGLVWTNAQVTTNNSYWEYTGNTTVGTSGQGLVYYQVTDGVSTIKGYLFVFRVTAIDYMETTGSFAWTYGWDVTNGGVYPGPVNNSGPNHFATVLPDNRVYFCNGSNIGKFFQTAPGTIFDPTNAATWTYLSFPLLPISDKAQCLAPLGTNALIGAQGNVVYFWDTTSSLVSNPILLPESNTIQIVTVNTTAYLFSGNKGNVYYTNGTQASLFVKIPDHISNTIEPYFIWSGAVYQKNRLYFGVSATDNAGNNLGNFAGIWCIDLATKALYLSNQLSFGSYGDTGTFSGAYCSALFAIPAVTGTNATGVGLYAGWSKTGSQASTGGLDATVSTPYTGGQSYIISDLIPIGTLLKPITPLQVEFKLSTPLLSGEKVEIQVSPSLLSGTSAVFTSALVTNGDGVLISDNSQKFPLQQLQWLLVKAILTGKASAPSYNRLKELRIIGATVPLTGIATPE